MLLDFLKTVFISPSQSRLRSGWRLMIQTGLVLVIFSCSLVPLAIFGELSLSGLGLLYVQLMECLGITLSVFLSRRFLDKRSFQSLGLKTGAGAGRDIGVGVGIAFLMVGVVTLSLSVRGWLTVKGYAWQVDSLPTVLSQSLLSLLIFTLVGWNEELLSRGYHLQNLTDGLGLLWAVVLSSAIFGGLHLTNPNATLAGASGVFMAGVFFCYAYLRSGRLWLPIGLHIGWNLFEGLVFGFPVSGLNTYRLVHVAVLGPERWTGGRFGPESGLVILPGILLGAVCVYVYTRRHDRSGDFTSPPDPISSTASRGSGPTLHE